MTKNRTAQLIYQTIYLTLGLVGLVASIGIFDNIHTIRWDFYVHFTNISNFLCIGVMLAGLIQTVKKKEDSFVSAAPILKFIGMLSILLTFLVFNIMLAGAEGRDPQANWRIGSLCFHVVLPIMYIADWFLFYERKKCKWYYPIASIAFPLVYVIFLLIQAIILKFDASILIPTTTTPLIYPYFFVNLDTQGVGGVLMWIGILSVAFVVVGFLFFGLDKLGKKKLDKQEGKQTVMKKDLIFAPIMLLIGVLLFLLRTTGMTAHIAISAIGVVVLVVYAVLTKKDWKIPALEIIMRAFYGVALITGIVIMNVHGIVALAVIHKVSAVLFMALIIVLLTHKVVTDKKA